MKPHNIFMWTHSDEAKTNDDDDDDELLHSDVFAIPPFTFSFLVSFCKDKMPAKPGKMVSLQGATAN